MNKRLKNILNLLVVKRRSKKQKIQPKLATKQERRGNKSRKEETCSLPFSKLPNEISFEILSFLYNDKASIDAYLACWFSSFDPQDSLGGANQENTIQHDLRQSITSSILSSPNVSTFFCRICSTPVCYPYKLGDCGCVVCGRCAYTAHQSLSPCGCGIRIGSRPQRLASETASSRATYILSAQENAKRLQRNERRVHREFDGVFGVNGIPNPVDPFDRLSFMEDYDALQKLDMQNDDVCIREILPRDCIRLFIILCPAHENFKPYIVESFDGIDDIGNKWPSFLRQNFFRSICNEDLVTLEEGVVEKAGDSSTSCRRDGDQGDERIRFEARLVGWEHLAGDYAAYDF